MNNGAIRAVVTDIEGTTSSLSFVKDVLFPYARAHLADFVRKHTSDATVRRHLNDAENIAGEPGMSDAQLVALLTRWIDEDRKLTPLKALQGLIWEDGYRRGELQGHIYEDAVRALRHWHALGLNLYVFSSGSVHAQTLLFAHTAYGDLTPLFSGYFDTTIGFKREPQAYSHIAQAAGTAPEQMVFLSDIREELDAARSAGMRTAWLVRGSTPDTHAAHRQVSDFDAIDLA